MSALGFKNAAVVRSSWLEEGGRRLDCNPYMSGALEARDTLRRLKARKQALHTLTAGFSGGIYNGPMFSRRWVEDRQFGVPFVGSSDMMNADLSNLPLLKESYARSKKLAHLELKAGMTLITCSGTIGRMAYVRPDMVGIWSSQHIMKVVPNTDKIRSGYLYAYLSSRYGVPLVVAGTYGAIIQHIEPEHIANLPVPRFSDHTETAIAAKVDAAAEARTAAVKLLREAGEALRMQLNLQLPTPIHLLPKPDVTSVQSATFQDRGDAYYYGARSSEARAAFDHGGGNQLLGKVAEVFIPGIFKRLYASDPQFGSPYITGGDVFEFGPHFRKIPDASGGSRIRSHA